MFFIVALLAAFCALAQALDYNCPSSGSSIHAGCQTKVVFQNGCDVVQSEIKNRISAQASGKWRDPHNNGTYTLISDTVDLFQVSRLTGDGKYTDKINFVFGSDSAQVACTMFACSESQVFSISGTWLPLFIKCAIP